MISNMLLLIQYVFPILEQLKCAHHNMQTPLILTLELFKV
jgi:hypothetical protein